MEMIKKHGHINTRINRIYFRQSTRFFHFDTIASHNSEGCILHYSVAVNIIFLARGEGLSPQ